METIPKQHFISLRGKAFDKFIDLIFDHYRREGFPYYPTNEGYRNARFEELIEADVSQVLNENIIGRTSQGTNLAWSYFRHSFEVKCGDMISPTEAFNDDAIFRKVIIKACKLGDSVSDSIIRGLIRLYTGVQSVSNFRPTAAAAIYTHYAPKGIIWDMSGGWGGRMLGAIKANVEYYIATEPSTKTFEGLKQLGKDYWSPKKFEIHKKGSEVFRPQKNSLQLCFTSPPYFNLEKYSDESSQSFKKFTTKQDWVDGFLTQTIENCYYGLKKNGYMILNIADPKKTKDLSLEQETLRAAKKVGFTHISTLALLLAATPLNAAHLYGENKNSNSQLYKTEPVFVFKK